MYVLLKLDRHLPIHSYYLLPATARGSNINRFVNSREER